MSERDQFGPGLRRERETRGISLKDIATRTKISASFFEALERNDLSRWPGGIFRRSFLRSYAESIEVDADRVVRDCARLFPCQDEGTVSDAGSTAADASREDAAGQSPRAGEPRYSTRTQWPLRTCAIGVTALATIGIVAGVVVGGTYLWASVGVTACIGLASAVFLFRQRRTVHAAAEMPSRTEPRHAATVVRSTNAQPARQAPASHHGTKRRGQVERFPRPAQRRRGKRGQPRA